MQTVVTETTNELQTYMARTMPAEIKIEPKDLIQQGNNNGDGNGDQQQQAPGNNGIRTSGIDNLCWLVVCLVNYRFSNVIW